MAHFMAIRIPMPREDVDTMEGKIGIRLLKLSIETTWRSGSTIWMFDVGRRLVSTGIKSEQSAQDVMTPDVTELVALEPDEDGGYTRNLYNNVEPVVAEIRQHAKERADQLLSFYEGSR